MALMLAPYNSAMRLGMGFNSYTQALCVNDVVRNPNDVPASESDLRAAQLTAKTDGVGAVKQITAGSVLEGASGSMARKIVDGQKEVSQVVSWEATFIENSSDILEKLDVSGALSIKMAGLGKLAGKAAFVDSTEVKKADINYLIHVKVVNQRLVADNMTKFCPIDHIEPGQFTEIYGDCFISGFIEGGEFDALVSITTEDSLKKHSLSGGLELAANVAGFDIEGKVEGGKTSDAHLKNAKTKISVTWSGGGDIREDSIKDWTIEKLKEVAMGFPDAVALAILTKYTSLRSFHEESKKGSPLDYENAGVYTAALYDAYTDYKILWKGIQTMISQLNTKEIELCKQQSSESLTKFAANIAEVYKTKKDAYDAAIANQKAGPGITDLVPVSSQSKALKPIEKPLPANKIELYEPDVFGLELAANDCRFEMIKIVREVDEVTKDPKVACDPDRIGQYLSPSVFRMLIPTPDKERLPTLDQWKTAKTNLKNKEEEVQRQESEISLIKKKLEAALITPRRDENDTLLVSAVKETAELHSSLQTSLSKLVYRADDYRMQSLLKDKKTISTGASFFNDLEDMELGVRPIEIKVWRDDKMIKGISVLYTNEKQTSHGKMENNPQDVLKLEFDEVITEVEVHIAKSTEDKLSVTAIAMATSKCNILTAGTKSGGKTYNFSIADDRQWSFRGFFGFAFNDAFEDLGIVWGKDTPTAAATTAQMPPAKNLLGMGSSLQEKTKKAMSSSKPSEHFYLGDCVSTGSTSSSANTFSALDTINGYCKINKLRFSASAGRLTGLKVEYSDNKQLVHGAFSQDQEVWDCEVKAPIIAAKLTVAKMIVGNATGGSATEPFVDTVELVCGEENGELPLWPLDVSTIRYLGVHQDTDRLEPVSKLTEQAPKLGRANWTLRGFYGEESQGIITRLGLIWGSA